MDEKKRMGMSPEKALEVFRSENVSNLKKARVKKGMSQQDLVNVSGVDIRVIQTYEQRNRNIDHARLSNLCDLSLALGVGIEDILEDEELKEKFLKCQEETR